MSLERLEAAPGTRSQSARPQSARPRVWPVYLVFVLALLATSIFTVALIWISYAMIHPGAAPSRAQLMGHALLPTTFILTIVLSALVLSGVSLGAAALSPVPLVERLSLRRPQGGFFPILAAMVGLPALSVVIENIALFSGVEISGTLEMIAGTISSAQGYQRVLIVLAISLGPGLGEELLFRGYIQTRLLERHAPSVAIIVTSLLFGLMHMDPLQSTLTVFMGAYLGFLVYRFETLWPAVGAHALNNGISALFITLFPNEPVTSEPSLLGMVLGAAVFCGCLTFVLRRVPSPL